MLIRLTLAAALLATPALCQSEDDGGGGSLNPEEMTLSRVMKNVRRGQTDMVTCATGYLMVKKGDHTAARELFQRCAEAGYTGAMTWLSQMDDNGLGAEENPDAATEWSRRAAEAGDPVGKFNYGLSLMRGRGVSQDIEAGRAMVDDAAAQGLAIAKRMQRADYDLDEVTPDADNWKYRPMF